MAQDKENSTATHRHCENRQHFFKSGAGRGNLSDNSARLLRPALCGARNDGGRERKIAVADRDKHNRDRDNNAYGGGVGK